MIHPRDSGTGDSAWLKPYSRLGPHRSFVTSRPQNSQETTCGKIYNNILYLCMALLPRGNYFESVFGNLTVASYATTRPWKEHTPR